MLWIIVMRGLLIGEDVELLAFHEGAETLDGTVDGKKFSVKNAVLCFCMSDLL